MKDFLEWIAAGIVIMFLLYCVPPIMAMIGVAFFYWDAALFNPGTWTQGWRTGVVAYWGFITFVLFCYMVGI